MVAGDVSRDGEGDEMGEHLFGECLPPGEVVRIGARFWVMFRVLCWLFLGLCWVSWVFLDRVPRVMFCVFNHFWVMSTVWRFSGLFRPGGGRLPLGKVASFGAPARGE
jgi:hypothetical protein